ncbi:YggS family pyridoxal phosphate-dependent enzyme [Thermosipho globiformans]|uniref:YggS family pyridoxal phosphate-dependent enzyme n=1 Tax=Thermosipho globiformans TaxID=380685 RepID=UPI000F8EDCAC|nr:YggS family pyridoxal phosphate-dependent enzyme [Thermosipho globiformans]
MSEIYKRYMEVVNSIKNKCKQIDRDYSKIKLVAVSKTFPVEVLKEAYDSGINIFGENYAQELRDKSKALRDYNIEWHFIGRIQLNKLKYIVPVASLIHSVSRIEEIKEIDKISKKLGKVQEILIQVNVSGEETKSGVKPEQLMDLIEKSKSYENVKVIGLMTMAPFTDNEEIIRNVFKKTRLLRDSVSKEFTDVLELSMGMSNDYLIALEEGATILRIGSKIFGPRK